MSPGEQLQNSFVLDRPRVEVRCRAPLADEPHQLPGVPFRQHVPRAIGALARVGVDELQMRNSSCGLSPGAGELTERIQRLSAIPNLRRTLVVLCPSIATRARSR